MESMAKEVYLILILISSIVRGQLIGSEEIDDSKVIPWISQLPCEYQYVYHFGDSEGESDFLLLFSNDSYYVQIKSGNWSEDKKNWIWHYENLKNIRIKGNQFYSDKFKGEFVIYDNGKERVKGLKLYDSENGGYEIGIKSYPVTSYFSGEFTQVSIRLLSKDELQKVQKSDLKLHRNEIFARYGFIFKSGGEMDSYFKQQKWYSGQHQNIDNFLTSIEKTNIKLIQQIESF